jgi:hypothetical protein
MTAQAVPFDEAECQVDEAGTVLDPTNAVEAVAGMAEVVAIATADPDGETELVERLLAPEKLCRAAA